MNKYLKHYSHKKQDSKDFSYKATLKTILGILFVGLAMKSMKSGSLSRKNEYKKWERAAEITP